LTYSFIHFHSATAQNRRPIIAYAILLATMLLETDSGPTYRSNLRMFSGFANDDSLAFDQVVVTLDFGSNRRGPKALHTSLSMFGMIGEA
jgi:hypothetical protein